MSDEPDPRRWRILAVTLLVGFMSLLDVTIVNVAIPSMRAGLDTTAGTVQWVVSGYALAFGLTLVAGGRLGDAHGRRRMMLIGLSGFIVSSAAVGLAPNIETVIAARLAQGATAGLLTPQNTGLIQQLFRGAERGRAFGFFGLTVSISSGLGPILGGLILAVAGEDEGWRFLFLVNVPIGLVALVAIARMVPGAAAQPDRDTRLDLVGAALLGLGVLCVLFPLVSLEGGARLPLVLLVLAPALLAGFVQWERRVVRAGGAPILDVGLLRRTPGYAGGLAIQTLYFTGFTGIFLVLSVYLQDGLGLTPADRRAPDHPVRPRLCADRAAGRAPGVGRGPAGHRHLAHGDDDRGARDRPPGARPGAGRPLVGDGADPAPRRTRRRWRDLPQLHAEPRGGAAGHGRRGRRGAPDRRPDRVGHRRGAADDGVPARRDAARAMPCRPRCSPPWACWRWPWSWPCVTCGSRADRCFHPDARHRRPRGTPCGPGVGTRSTSTKPYLV